MDSMHHRSIKYRIKSYYYETEHAQELLFTIEEIGVPGEFRQYAREILQCPAWECQFSCADAAKIRFAQQLFCEPCCD